MNDPYKYFLIESKELLAELTKGFLALEKEGDNPEMLRHVFRYAHTLKGAAGVVGLRGISDIAHKMEDHLAGIRDEKIEIQPENITQLLKNLDAISEMVDNIREGKSEKSEGPLVSATKEKEAPLVQTEVAAPVEQEMANSGQEMAYSGQEMVSDGQPVIEPENVTAPETIRLDSHEMERLTNFSNETIVNISGLKNLVGQVKEAGKHFLYQHKEVEGLLDTLDQNLEQTGLFIQEMNDVIMDLRLKSVAEASYIFEKAVRKVAVSCDKAVDFRFRGKDTLVDRSLLDGIVEPICHLLRNGVIHGVELPGQRNLKGKPEKARIHLKFEKKDDTLRVVCEDDGMGLDLEKIKAIAIAKKFMDADTARELTENEVRFLIFESGFSSADALTQLAGRGVGLDVVKNSVAAIGGSIQIESEKDRFTRFILTLPLSINIKDAFMVEVAGNHLLIPLQYLIETRLITKEEIVTEVGRRIISYKGSPVPVADLSDILNLTSDKSHSGIYKAMILRYNDDIIALTATQLKGKKKIPIKPLSGKMKSLAYVTASTILENGDPAFVLDVAELFSGIRKLRIKPVDMDTKEPEIQKSILVVDDSLTTRTLISGILENEGYTVMLGHSGDDALKILAGNAFDLIVTDIEMPGIDGFQLTSRVLQIPEYKEMPIVIMSSRGSDNDKKKGLEAGANAYVVKSEFDQEEFLETIESLI